MLEIADREFQAVQDEDERLRAVARQSVYEGRLSQVEITADALKAYLDSRFGVDGRMTEDSYSYLGDNLRRLGFQHFQQIEECIAPYDLDRISRLNWGVRQGQMSRFQETVLAAMGNSFIIRSDFGLEPWFIRSNARKLKILRDAGVTIGCFRPTPELLNGRYVVLRAAIQSISGEEVENATELQHALNILNSNEAKIIRLVYGFEGGHPHSFDEVGLLLGIAAWTVNEMLIRAMKRLESIDASIENE
jgi:DNA-directed RNA polymerase specialized sigma24 family protein